MVLTFSMITIKSNLLYVCLICIICSTLRGANSATVKDGGVSAKEKKIIVNKHNDLRKFICDGRVPGQPKGYYMKQMKYDEALAKEAQKISNFCKFEHADVQDERWHAVGQNLYMSISTKYKSGANWAKAIQEWFNEHKIYQYGQSFSTKTGHYTQVVWADTEYVGCGYSHCENGNQYEKIYTCNYGPAGNVRGNPPYKVTRN